MILNNNDFNRINDRYFMETWGKTFIRISKEIKSKINFEIYNSISCQIVNPLVNPIRIQITNEIWVSIKQNIKRFPIAYIKNHAY